MRMATIGLAVLVSTGLFACAPGQIASRNETDVTAVAATASGRVASETASNGAYVTVRESYRIRHFAIDVPKSLLVSEADVYYPIADIVWHGDPAGDRYKQVKTIVADSFKKGAKGMNGDRLVDVNVQLTRFHALSDKSRATVGGDFNVDFYLTIKDAKTGEILVGPRFVDMNERAAGGVEALREESRGITQKAVIVAALSKLFREELTRRQVPVSSPEAVSRNDFSPSDLTIAQ